MNDRHCQTWMIPLGKCAVQKKRNSEAHMTYLGRWPSTWVQYRKTIWCHIGKWNWQFKFWHWKMPTFSNLQGKREKENVTFSSFNSKFSVLHKIFLLNWFIKLCNILNPKMNVEDFMALHRELAFPPFFLLSFLPCLQNSLI